MKKGCDSLEISMPRGDLRQIAFTVSVENADTVGDFDDIFMTVKRTYEHTQSIFQKRLSDGSIEKTGDADYQFTILPEDTNKLQYGKYVFDIEFVREDEIKQTFVGDLIITPEVTFAGNEV